MLRVPCKQKTCLYHNEIEGPQRDSHCDCGHSQKEYYINELRCPLFRMNWEKNSPGVKNPLDIIRAKREF